MTRFTTYLANFDLTHLRRRFLSIRELFSITRCAGKLSPNRSTLHQNTGSGSLKILFILALSGIANAEEKPSLESIFESTTIQIKALPDSVNIPIEWKYTNHEKNLLMVDKFEESCGCLSGKLEQQALETSKSGVIRASFTSGPNRGLIRKSLHVRFVGYEKPIELIVEAVISSSVELSSKELTWNVGEEMKVKTIDVTTGTNADFNIIGLIGAPETLFTITQETLTPTRHYRIHITPLSGNTSPGVHCLQVRTDSKDARDQILPVFLRIAPALDPPANPSP